LLMRTDCEGNGGNYMGDNVPCLPSPCGPASGVQERMVLLTVAQTSPNPASSQVTISYGVPVATDVSVAILDASGRLVRRLVDAKQGAGNHSVVWDRRDDAGRPVPSGIYFFRAQGAGRTFPGRIIALK
jgi:hypothetical protein